MKALILVGGLGTRLRPMTVNIPKAMMPVLNMPFMGHVVERLVQHGVSEVIFTRGHLAGQMERYFGNGTGFGLKVTYVNEPYPLGTAGGIKNCQALLDDGTFLVLNGDVYSHIDYTAMLRLHRERQAMASIALTTVDNPAAFGLVETESDGRIRRFLEKPKADEIMTNMINAGCYLLEPEVLDYIPPDIPVSVERQTFQLLLAESKPFYGYDISSAYWIDMGNREKYFQLNLDLLPTSREVKNYHGKGTKISPSARIMGSVVIGDNCRVEAGAVINGPAVIGESSCIGAGTVITKSLIWSEVNIGDGADIRCSIIADRCSIGSGAQVDGAALADGVFVGPSLVLSGSTVWPGTILNN
ncbi:MAG: sugar phosphate nucleotidyltransferase [Dehalogenimonas sp.]